MTDVTHHHAIRPLFSSALVRVLDFRCGPEQPRATAEWAEVVEIAVPRRGIYLRRSSYGDELVDTTTALFFNHGQDYEIGHPAGGGDETTVFLLEPESLWKYVTDELGGRYLGSGGVFPRGTLLIGPVEQALHQLLYRISMHAEPTDKLQLQELCALLVGRLIKHMFQPGTDGHNAGATSQVSDRARLWAATHFTQPISLQDIADGVGYSQFHLARCFKAATGLTLHRYITRLRLLESLNRLSDMRGRNISVIAHDLGFSSHSHFSRAFVQEFHTSPSAFGRAISKKRTAEMRKILQDSLTPLP